MKTARVALGVLLILTGGVWFLQGIGVLKGSVMTDETTWAVVGPLVALVGVALVVTGRRKD